MMGNSKPSRLTLNEALAAKYGKRNHNERQTGYWNNLGKDCIDSMWIYFYRVYIKRKHQSKMMHWRDSYLKGE